MTGRHGIMKKDGFLSRNRFAGLGEKTISSGRLLIVDQWARLIVTIDLKMSRIAGLSDQDYGGHVLVRYQK